MADLCALADGTLPVGRRAEVEARIAASPELQELLERQRAAVLATQPIAAEEPPTSLRMAVDAQRSALGSRRRRGREAWTRFALAGAAAVAAVIVAAVVLTGGPGGPSVADAARLGTQSPTAPAPPPAGTAGTRLGISVQGVAFPDFAQFAGWHATGLLYGKIDGRDAIAVFYRKDGKRIAYVIVAGSELAEPSGAQSTTRRGVGYRTLQVNGRPAVTWRRDGHTCVLIGQAPPAELVRLASWPLTLPR